MKELAGQIQSGEFSLSDEGYRELKNDYLALVLTVVDIVDGAAYLFEKECPAERNRNKQSLMFHFHCFKYIVIIRRLFLHVNFPFFIYIIPIGQPKRNQVLGIPFLITRSCVYSHVTVVGKKENIQRIVDALQEMQMVMKELALCKVPRLVWV